MMLVARSFEAWH